MVGKLFLIGVGPGSSEYLTAIAKQRLIKLQVTVSLLAAAIVFSVLFDTHKEPPVDISLQTVLSISILTNTGNESLF